MTGFPSRRRRTVLGAGTLALGLFAIFVILDRSGPRPALAALVVGSGVFGGTSWLRARWEKRAILRIQRSQQIPELEGQVARRLGSPARSWGAAIGSIVGIQVFIAVGSTAWIMWVVMVGSLFASAVLLGRPRLMEFLDAQ